MSIYATIGDIGIRRFGDENMVEIRIQGVPSHIDYTGAAWDFLPPPVSAEENWRAVFLVEVGTPKGTPRCGQEYEKPLLVLTGREYETVGFAELLGRIEEALDRKYGQRPTAIVHGPDGAKKNIYPQG
jgi:hypothetical protein